MDVHRINGIKFNFERLTEDDLEGIRGHLVEDHRRVTDELALVEGALFARRHEALPGLEDTGIANYERVLGHACLAGDITAEEAYRALGEYGHGLEQA